MYSTCLPCGYQPVHPCRLLLLARVPALHSSLDPYQAAVMTLAPVPSTHSSGTCYDAPCTYCSSTTDPCTLHQPCPCPALIPRPSPGCCRDSGSRPRRRLQQHSALPQPPSTRRLPPPTLQLQPRPYCPAALGLPLPPERLPPWSYPCQVGPCPVGPAPPLAGKVWARQMPPHFCRSCRGRALPGACRE